MGKEGWMYENGQSYVVEGEQGKWVKKGMNGSTDMPERRNYEDITASIGSW